MKETVSLIIPAFNAEKYIERCIESLIHQTYINIEIIIVDDGSIDNTFSIAKKYELLDARLHVYSIANHGVSFARNFGFKHSTGEYVVFIDSDDFLQINAIESLINNHTDNRLVGLTIYECSEGMDLLSACSCMTFDKETFLNYLITGRVNGFSFGYLINRNLFVKYDENIAYMEDFLVMLELCSKFDEIEFVDSFYYYWQNSMSVTKTKEISQIIKNINNMCFSICLAQERIQNCKYRILEKRKQKIIESEVSKIKSKKDIKSLYESKVYLDIKNSFKKCSLKYIPFKFCLLTKSSFITFLYLKIRTFMKRMKVRKI